MAQDSALPPPEIVVLKAVSTLHSPQLELKPTLTDFLTKEDSHITKEKRKVTIGLRDYQKAEIVSGITEHDILLKPAQ